MIGRVLVVHGQARRRQILVAALKKSGFGVVEAGDGEEAWSRFCADSPDLVVTDLAMPRCEGRGLLRRIRHESDVPVIVFTVEDSLDSAMAALEAGADEFISDADVKIPALVDLVGSLMAASSPPSSSSGLGKRIAGPSPAMQRCRSRIVGLAPLRSPVLVLGEEGTGRSAVVAALHESGSSAGEPLFTVECSGSESARGMPRSGAIHLRGVHRLSPDAQIFFRDCIRESERKHFAEGPRFFASGDLLPPPRSSEIPRPGLLDVLGRLAIELPPLRERPVDIPEIAEALVDKLGVAMGRRARLSASAMSFLVARSWPGNIAQLEGFLERAVAFNGGRWIRRDHLLELADDQPDDLGWLRRQRESRERDELFLVLRETSGNISQAAEKMHRSRASVYRLIEKYGVRARP